MLVIYIEKTEFNAACRMFLSINVKKKYHLVDSTGQDHYFRRVQF
jgi:hypothetical protein